MGEGGLGPGGGVGAVGVGNAADCGELAVEVEMGVEVARRLELAGGDGSFEGADDHLLPGEVGVVDSAGLDDDLGWWRGRCRWRCRR